MSRNLNTNHLAPASVQEYDAFISYSTSADYKTARKVEAFLESFHQLSTQSGPALRHLQICRDGSDFKLPTKQSDAHPPLTDDDPIWMIIQNELQKSNYLIVLCSTSAVTSTWVSKEIAWFINNKGPERILPVLTVGADPTANPDAFFPKEIIAAGIHIDRIWYDLRGYPNKVKDHQVRDFEDELVRLASDLLDWDATSFGPLSTVWQREQLKKRRRQARMTIAIGMIVILLACLAIWKAVQAQREALHAKVSALMTLARTQQDPLASFLILNEAVNLVSDTPPYGATNLAHRLASTPRPSKVLRGHGGAVVSVVFDHSGDKLLTASEDGTARIWYIKSKRSPVVLKGHQGPVVDVMFSKDDKFVLTASLDGTARIWSSTESVQPVVLQGHQGAVRSAKFDSDNNRIVTASDDGTARIWSVTGGIDTIVLRGHEGAVRSAIFSSTGEQVLTASEDGTSRLWSADGKGNRLVSDFHGLAKSWSARFNKDNSMILLSSSDNTGWLFSTEMKLPFITLPGHSGEVRSADFSPDGKWIVTASRDGTARVWSTAYLDWFGGKNESAFELTGHSGPLRKAIFSPGSNLIATVSEDGSTRVWDMTQTRGPLILGHHDGSVLDAAFSPDEKRLATASSDRTIRIWDMEGLVEPVVVGLHPGPVAITDFDAAANLIVTVAKDGVLWLWRREDSNYSKVFQEGHESVKLAQLNEQGTQLVIITVDGTVRRFDVEKMATIFSRPLSGIAVRQFSISPDGVLLVTISQDNVVQVQRVDGTGHSILLEGHLGDVKSARFSRDGRYIVTAGEDKTVRVWRVDGVGDAVILRGHEAVVNDASFSADGRYVLSVSDDATARVWDARGDSSPIVLRGHLAPVYSAAFSEDGAKVITGSSDGARVWRLDNTDEPVELNTGTGTVVKVRFNREGTKAITTSNDGQVQIWRIDWNLLINYLRRATDACLSADQRVRLLGETPQTAEAEYGKCE